MVLVGISRPWLEKTLQIQIFKRDQVVGITFESEAMPKKSWTLKIYVYLTKYYQLLHKWLCIVKTVTGILKESDSKMWTYKGNMTGIKKRKSHEIWYLISEKKPIQTQINQWQLNKGESIRLWKYTVVQICNQYYFMFFYSIYFISCIPVN